MIASVADTHGEADRVLAACAVGVAAAEAAGHLGEVAELLFLRAVTLAETGDVAAAADAYGAGLSSVTAWTDGLRGQLACGLAETLLLTGDAGRAVEVLDAHDDARQSLHATAVRWRAGHASESDVRAAAAAAADADLPPLTTVVFALARLAVPGADAAAHVAEGRRLALHNDQQARAARLDEAIAAASRR